VTISQVERTRLRNAAVYLADSRYVGRYVPLSAIHEIFGDGRTLDQNAKFHAMCEDVARRATWAGEKRTRDQWKVLFVSGHAIATGRGAEVVEGLEGEFVNIRESTAAMSKARLSSLIEYVTAWCAGNGVKLREVAG
jgi:hypothetical protein